MGLQVIEALMHKLTAGLLCLVLAAAAVLGGCEQDRGTGAGYLFSYTLDANPRSLDPQLAEDEASLTVIGNMFSGLFRMEDTGAVTPDVAESYEISPDGCTYTIRMTITGTPWEMPGRKLPGRTVRTPLSMQRR